MFDKRLGRIIALGLFAGGLLMIWIDATRYCTSYPGNAGDPRFNHLILEHLYEWCSGSGMRLWSPTFFYPYEHVLAFSDNHFGTGIVYVLGRILGFSRENAFDFWFLTAYPLNFFAALYALNRLGLNRVSSAFGAFIFTYSLPILAQESHAQLGYRFAIPFAFLCLQRMLEFKGKRAILAGGFFLFWTGWQFACSIYLGYFLCLTSVAWVMGYLLTRGASAYPESGQEKLAREINSWLLWLPALAGISIIIGTLLPYALVSWDYHLARPKEVIDLMIPRPASYLLADRSWFSGYFGRFFESIPLRWEHQMFVGLVPLILLCIGVAASFYQKVSSSLRYGRTAAVCLAILIFITTIVDGSSLYHLFIHLPLANAIRAVSRIILVMLFPIALLCGAGISYLENKIKKPWLRIGITFIFAVAMLLEVSHFKFETLSFEAARERIAKLHELLPGSLQEDAILYFGTNPKETYETPEIDAMLMAQELKLPTCNGYSGSTPPGHVVGNSYVDALVQMAVYCKFRGYDKNYYLDLAHRIIAIRCERVEDRNLTIDYVWNKIRLK